MLVYSIVGEGGKMYSQTLSSLIGGLSRQPKYSRPDSQCEDCLNVEFDYLRGLKKRPGSYMRSWINQLIYGISSDTVYSLFQLSTGEAYVVLFDDSATTPVYIVDLDGNVQTVNYVSTGGDGGASVKAYARKIAQSSVAHNKNGETLQLGDTLLAINKSDTVQMNPAGSLFTDVLFKQINTVYVKRFLPDTTYQVTVFDSVYGTTTQSVTTGATGDTAGIANSLQGAINGVVTGWGTGAEVVVVYNANNSVFNIVRAGGGLGAGGTLEVTVSDGYGHEGIIAGKRKLPSIADLPPAYPYGWRQFEIVGDDYQGGFYLKWDDTEKAWIETSKLETPKGWDPDGLPLIIYPDPVSANTFWVDHVDFSGREIGDEDTAPTPSFEGNSITSIFFYQNRLGFTSKNNVILSRIGDYFNFFPETALESLDSDPIDIAISPSQSSFLQYTVPFDESIILSTYEEQFLLTGEAGVLTPLSAQIQSISSYPIYLKPFKAQDYLYFVAGKEDRQKLYRYQVTNDTKRYKAIDISGNVEGLLEDVHTIYFDDRANRLLLYKDTEVYVLYAKEVFDGKELRSVGGWSIWRFPLVTLPLGNVDDDFYFLAAGIPSLPGIGYIPIDGGLIEVYTSNINMDLVVYQPTTVAFTTIDGEEFYVYNLPYELEDEKVYWLRADGSVTDLLIDTEDVAVAGTTDVYIPADLYTASVGNVYWLGVGMEWLYEFSTFYPRDKHNNAITTGQTILRGLQLQYEDTTSMRVGVEQRGGSKYYLEGLDNYPFSITPGPETGGKYFPIFGNNEWITVTLEDISPYSLLVNQATFIYSYSNRFKVF